MDHFGRRARVGLRGWGWVSQRAVPAVRDQDAVDGAAGGDTGGERRSASHQAGPAALRSPLASRLCIASRPPRLIEHGLPVPVAPRRFWRRAAFPDCIGAYEP
jgi:hypothetical protein